MATAKAKKYTYKKSMDLFRKAAQFIPGGIYGHQSPTILVPGRYPYYTSKTEGAYFWDPDGNKFLDLMCAYGPIILGYQHPKVEEATAAYRRVAGTASTQPPAIMVELAERMVNLVAHADWVVFAKNGSDATTYAMRVAREQTHRPKILMAGGAYHGAHAWCTPGHGGLVPEDRTHIHNYRFNDIEGIRRLIEEQYKDQVAAIIMTPYHHPAFADSEMPTPDFYPAVRGICDKNGVMLIVDDVRAGFRLSLKGSHHFFGVRPDLVAFSKAIANGYPLSAVTGGEHLKMAAGRVFFTGSFWSNADSFAASLATLAELEAIDGVALMNRLGAKLKAGYYDAAKAHGLQISITGPNTIPYMKFANETDFRRMQTFAAECTERGVFTHPHHNWFISAAMTDADIDFAIDVADQAFAVVKKTFGG